ncbi:DnaB-like helicase C-terminal domain-containing protein [Cohnella yongneupensis]|uniref:DnaB-like helicase C-terminal domain-containing protein n=1 Tax=Cohnella yongneupensis TaxID=425006 RepID=A0ABW0R0B5_9BACL
MENIVNILTNDEMSHEEKVKKAQERLLEKNLGNGNNLMMMLDRIKDYGRAIPTGYSEIDDLLNGGFRQGVSIVAAPPGMGKSTFAIQLAEQFSSAGVQTVYLCNDMSEEETISKAVSRHTYHGAGEQGFSAAQILGGQVMASPLFHQACEQFQKNAKMLRIEGDEFSRDLQQIKMLLEVYGAYGTNDYTVVIIDYLQNIQVEQASNAKERLDILVKELKSSAKRLGLIIIAISSVNRGSYHYGIKMESLKESGDIEFGADLILGIQYEGVENADFDERAAALEPIRNMELVVLKHRLGGAGTSVPIKFYPKYSAIPWYDQTPKLRKTSLDRLLKRN